ncbi:MAG: DUF2470 domain-containing protein [Alphaproteobacteria bacterium]|nr:DUF2470 domain-containing protein [Alphaproteobacteria bacterium]
MNGDAAAALGADIRALLRGADRAALSTVMREGTEYAPAGAPYGSLVLAAWGHDAAPLLLLSDLADHTKNLQQDPRCSLMVDAVAGLEDPLTGARVTLVGEIAQSDDPTLAARFLARHPSAELYAGFGDFNLYHMTIQSAHLVAGFGRIHWLAGEAVRSKASADLLAQEAEVVAHMNEDHSDAVGLYANRLLGLPGVGWRLTGIDPEGADLHRQGARGRLSFKKPVSTAEEARVELVRLVKQARATAR